MSRSTCRRERIDVRGTNDCVGRFAHDIGCVPAAATPRIVLAIAAAGAVALGAEGACVISPRIPGDYTITLPVEGYDRVFDLHIPTGVDGAVPVPLLLDLHGLSGTKETQRLRTNFLALADSEGFLLVYPQGYENSWNGGDVCCGPAQTLGLDDVGLLVAIVEEVSSSINVDHSRVYSTGHSNGGVMSHRLACEAAGVFAAVAPVASPLDFADPSVQCEPERPIAISHFHGYDDVFAPYLGNAQVMPARDSFSYWRDINLCAGSATVTWDDGANNICETYTTCDADVESQLCSIEGGHNLYANAVMNLEDVAWRFLTRFRLPLPDLDDDGVANVDDNCVNVANASQDDLDHDCVGDGCEIPRPNLLRNDETVQLDRASPAFAGIFVGTGVNSLDAVGPSGDPKPGEGPSPGDNGSIDLDDMYWLAIASPFVEPDRAALTNVDQPLVLYQLHGRPGPLLVIKSDSRLDIVLSF